MLDEGARAGPPPEAVVPDRSYQQRARDVDPGHNGCVSGHSVTRSASDPLERLTSCRLGAVPGGRSTRWTSSRVPGAKTGQELLRIQRLRRINGDTPGDVFDSPAAAT